MVVLNRVIVMALVLSIRTAWSSHPSDSGRNQYGAREDVPQPLGQLAKATDHPSEDHLSNHSDLETTKRKADHNILSSPSGATFPTHNKRQHLRSKKINDSTGSKKLGRRELVKLQRNRRSFIAWSQKPTYEAYPSITVWRTYRYPISRPYFIPIYGVPGRLPIYFPPQPLIRNPGRPVDNPKKPFQGPMYLPPKPEPTPVPIPDDIDNRFNGGDNGDDMIVFPNYDESSQNRPTTTSERPTRYTTQAGQTSTHPPIVHNVENNNQRPTAAPPASSNQQNAPARPVQRPTTPTPPVRGPSQCVWAIVSCCSVTGEISQNCFEARGCGRGFFFDGNPCESDFAQSALESALNYYENN